jgi:hypothetical protein
MFKIVLLFLFFFACEKKDPDHKKYGYRLGDMVTAKEFRDMEKGRAFHYRNFPDSIATEYMKKTDEDNRYDLLADIVTERIKTGTQNPPPSDTLVVHLRIGDVLDDTPYMVKDFLSRNILYVNGINYVKPIPYYELFLAQNKHIPFKHITLLGGFHLPLDSKKKSLRYVKEIRQFFEKKGFSVSERIDRDPDEDFIYMCRGAHYLSSGGGYSKLVREVRNIYGKKSF